MSASWWERWRTKWSDGWQSLADQVDSTWQSIVDSDPTGVKSQSEEALTQLTALWDRHVYLRDSADKLEGLSSAERQALWDQSAQLRTNVLSTIALMQEDPKKVLGVDVGNPVALALVGVALAALYVMREYIQAWDAQTAVASRELDARWEAMRTGKVLQPSTLTLPDSPLKDVGDGVSETVGGVAKVAGVLVVGGLVLGAAWWAANRAS